jgi:hypothetical protein
MARQKKSKNAVDIEPVLRTVEECKVACEQALTEENLTDWQRGIYERTLNDINKEVN